MRLTYRLVALGLGLGLGGPPTWSRAEILRVATYNVENYGPANRMTEAGFRSAYPKPEAEKAALRRVIRALGADLLALQEMGDSPYVKELQRDLRAEGLDYPVWAEAEAEDRERHVALLSRRPLESEVGRDLVFPYRGGMERVKRGLLEASVATAAGPVRIFAVHLKSHLTERADDPEAAQRRAAEAAAIREQVRREFPPGGTGLYLILGDCNDGRDSAAVRLLEGGREAPLTWRVPAADSRGETWTEFYRRAHAYVELDHILVAPALRPAVREAHIYDGPGTEEASDHRPVLAVFALTSSRP